jgi:uncharacterized sulfatase
LAISWPGKIRKGQTSDELVSLIDLAPTFLNIAGINNVPQMTGKSLVDILFNKKNTADQRNYVLTGRERHSHSRPDDLGYPSRAIRTKQFLFILNCKPDLWPAGDPPPPGEEKEETQTEKGGDGDTKGIGLGYNDIDDPSPTKSLMIEKKDQWPDLFEEGFAKRPEEQLFDIKKDPACRHNLVSNPKYNSVKKELRNQLEKLLKEQGDPRMLGYGDIFDSYPRFGLMRNWPGFKERGKYNPAYIPKGYKK